MNDQTHPNLSVMEKLDVCNLDDCSDLFAKDFVWHYFNPRWLKVEGDYQGVAGLKAFFAEMSESSNGALQVHPVQTKAMGDELVVVHARNRFVSADEGVAEFDAVVVWRIVDGKITEAWDIPDVHTMRTIDQTAVDSSRFGSAGTLDTVSD